MPASKLLMLISSIAVIWACSVYVGSFLREARELDCGLFWSGIVVEIFFLLLIVIILVSAVQAGL